MCAGGCEHWSVYKNVPDFVDNCRLTTINKVRDNHLVFNLASQISSLGFGMQISPPESSEEHLSVLVE